MAKLKFIALSGTTDVTENLYIYEYGDDMIIVDCGVGFPEQEMLGVDLVIPDFTYIKENKDKLKAILITHGHEDHIGAVPFLLKDVNVPVYSTELVAGFLEDKFKDYGVQNYQLNVFNTKDDVIEIGPFKIMPFAVSHSVPNSAGFMIDTPEGKMFHVPDYKFDWNATVGEKFDVAKAARLAEGEVLALASDCLGSTTPGYTASEDIIGEHIERIAREAEGRIYFTTISSNISRMQQAINVAEKLGKKVAFVGRSIDSKAEIARQVGYLKYKNNQIVRRNKINSVPVNQMMIIISGAYGQPGSNLYRLAVGEHQYLSLDKNDTVIFSADPAPPGTKENVDYIVDRMIEQDVNVYYYELQEDLHTSGHGSQGDIYMLMGLIQPKYYIPIGGTIRFMRAYKDLAMRMGAKEEEVLELLPGEVVEFDNGQARPAGNVPSQNVLVDGLGVGDVGKIVLRDRKKLAEDGIAIAMIQIDSKEKKLIEDPDIISRGFVYHGGQKEFLEQTAKELAKELNRTGKVEKKSARNITIEYLENIFFEKTGRRPMVMPVIVEV